MKVFEEYLSLASEETIESSLKIDAPQVSSADATAYANRNRLGYTVCVNCWLSLIKQWSPYAWMFVSKRIGERGLLATIKSFDAASNSLVRGEDISDTLAASILRDVQRSNAALPPIAMGSNVGTNPLATALLLFRFPKRFSPIGADLLQQKSIQDFISTENRTKLLQRREASRFVIPFVKARVYSLDWERFTRNWTWDLSRGMFTPGVCYETGSSQVQKVEVLSRQCPEVLGTMMGTYYAPMQCTESPIMDSSGFPRQRVRIMAVPKSYKSARIVAPEELQRQMLARRAFDEIQRILPSEINLHDQTQNQRLCELGAATGDLATIDLSSASDCVSATLVRTIFPREVIEILDRLTANEYETPDGKVRVLQQYSTMGNSLTFIIESIVFWAIARGCMDMIELLVHEPLPDLPVSVYGDDIIVPTYAAQTCCEWLQHLGFLVNEDKSFISQEHRYRESCGVEWFEGVEVSSVYWPRKEIRGSLSKGHASFSPSIIRDGYTGREDDCTTILVQLQHRLYGVCEHASQYLTALILSVHPLMTMSCYGSNYGDLWGPDDTSKEGWAPVSKELWKQLQGKEKPDYLRRSLRYRMVVSTQGKVSPHTALVWDQYKYTEFLKHGPYYASGLDELLGISTPRPAAHEVAGKPVAKWILRT